MVCGRTTARLATAGLAVVATAVLTVAVWAQSPDVGPAAVPPTIGNATLPRDLSPWGMFVNADIVVKAVMIGLLIASLVTWTVWLAKVFELAAAKRKARAGLRVLQEARSLAEAERRLGDADDAVARLVRTAAHGGRAVGPRQQRGH